MNADDALRFEADRQDVLALRGVGIDATPARSYPNCCATL